MTRSSAVALRKSAAGFTLLEVMIAVAILSVSLMALSLTMIRSVRVSNHARLMTQATFLCRMKLGEIEDDYVTNGFTDDAGVVQKKDKFEDPLFKKFRWNLEVRKIELPSADKIQTAATKLLQDKQKEAGAASPDSSKASDGSSGANSGLSGSMGGLMGPVKQMLEQGIRKVSVRVVWDEPGLPEQQIEVVTFYTDMRRIPLGTS